LLHDPLAALQLSVVQSLLSSQFALSQGLGGGSGAEPGEGGSGEGGSGRLHKKLHPNAVKKLPSSSSQRFVSFSTLNFTQSLPSSAQV